MASEKSPSISSTDAKVSTNVAMYAPAEMKALDVALALVKNPDNDTSIEPVSPAESARLLRKIDWHLLPLLFFVNTVQFIDKSSIASSAVLGLIQDNHLTTHQFNNLASALWIGSLVFAWPQSWALQRLPVGKWLSFNIFLWAVFQGLQAVCHNFSGLFALRFLLGASEVCMSEGLIIIAGMFYTRREVSERIGWTYQFQGLAIIISGFLSYAFAHVSPAGSVKPWQWFSIASALLTLVSCVLFLLFFPDNPINAWFLTPEERVLVVHRVRENQNGIETRAWKKYQVVEALLDIKTWLYFALASFGSLTGGISVQYALLIKGFGFTLLETTLLGVPSGFALIIGITVACLAVRYFPNSRTIISSFCWLPAIVACLIQLGVPYTGGDKVAHLVGIYLATMGTAPPLILAMSFIVSNVSGHTKKTTTTAIALVGVSLGNTLAPQFWLDKYKPANHVPWGVVLMANLSSVICTLILRGLYKAENHRRDRAKAQALRTGAGLDIFDDFAVVGGADGESEIAGRRVVEKRFLDMTDSENQAFRYVT